MAELPIACTLTPEALRARGSDLLPGLANRAHRVETLPDGARLTFTTSPGLLLDIAGVLEQERECCPFLAFTLSAAPEEGEVALDVTGPEGTRAFLASLGLPVAARSD